MTHGPGGAAIDAIVAIATENKTPKTASTLRVLHMLWAAQRQGIVLDELEAMDTHRLEMLFRSMLTFAELLEDEWEPMQIKPGWSALREKALTVLRTSWER